MEAHAAFPYPQDRHRVSQHFWAIKQDIANAATKQHAQGRIKQEVVDIFLIQWRSWTP